MTARHHDRPVHAHGATRAKDKRRVERYLTRLYNRTRPHHRHAERPGPMAWARPFRVGLGILLVIGGLLGFLPVLGYWMIPLGLVLLAQDVAWLRRPVGRALVVAERRWRRLRRRWQRRRGRGQSPASAKDREARREPRPR